MYSVMVTEHNVYICRKHPESDISIAVMNVVADYGSMEQRIELAGTFVRVMNETCKRVEGGF